MKSILGSHWSSNMSLANFGDYAIVPLLAAMGYEYQDFPETNRTLPEGHDFVLVGIGSVLNSGFTQRFVVPTKFWGSGVAFRSPKVPKRANHQFLAVRGPISVEVMELPENTPQGDPLFLAPQLLELTHDGNGKKLYIPHLRAIINDEFQRAQLLTSIGAETYASTLLPHRDQFNAFAGQVLGASLVGTGSLHAFILRKAFGLPVALLLPNGLPISNEVKWADTFAFLGIQGDVSDHVCETMQEAADWWDQIGQHAVIPDLNPLLSAFPLPVPAVEG